MHAGTCWGAGRKRCFRTSCPAARRHGDDLPERCPAVSSASGSPRSEQGVAHLVRAVFLVVRIALLLPAPAAKSARRRVHALAVGCNQLRESSLSRAHHVRVTPWDRSCAAVPETMAPCSTGGVVIVSPCRPGSPSGSLPVFWRRGSTRPQQNSQRTWIQSVFHFPEPTCQEPFLFLL